MAKSKSIFDDKPVEIQELTYIIKQDINSLNKQIAELQGVSGKMILISTLILFIAINLWVLKTYA